MRRSDQQRFTGPIVLLCLSLSRCDALSVLENEVPDHASPDQVTGTGNNQPGSPPPTSEQDSEDRPILRLGSAPQASEQDGEDPEVTGTPPDPNGQTGSVVPSAIGCEASSECAAGAEAELATLATPAEPMGPFTFATCSQITAETGARAVSGSACQCSSAGSRGFVIGPVGVGCFARGRAGDCLFDDSEFMGCAPNSDDCTAVCSELEARLDADNSRTFQTRLIALTCEEAMCHNVIEIDGRCYADGSYRLGRDYDCALGIETILDLEQDAQVILPLTELPPATSLYAAGTDGFVDLSVYSEWSGTARTSLAFGAVAQFFEVASSGTAFGDVIDPLEGIDDCGVSVASGLGTGDIPAFFSVDEATLLDGPDEYALEGSIGNSDFFSSYLLDLTGLGVEPSYGRSYGFRASGGTFAASVEVDGLLLPEALSVPSLESLRRADQATLPLIWTGGGVNPLRFGLSIAPILADTWISYDIECLATDDGMFEIPGDILQAAPPGFVVASFRRENRSVVPEAGKTLTLIGSVNVTHRFALGPPCDRPDVVAACLAYAASIQETYAACGDPQPPPPEVLCPDYLVESCVACPEYFECRAANTRCEDGIVTSITGCFCP